MDNGASSYRRFLSGDNNGLSEIVREYREGLTLYINTIISDIDTAEELMEDTFAKLYAERPKFSEKSSFKTWLYSIGRNTALYYIRKNRLRQTSYLDDQPDIAGYDDIEKEHIKSEEKIILHRALQRLKSDYSQILYLIYFEELTNGEAALIMKKKDKQIRDLLYNAKKALRSELEKEGYIYEGI